jgi:hypothetical protein
MKNQSLNVLSVPTDVPLVKEMLTTVSLVLPTDLVPTIVPVLLVCTKILLMNNVNLAQTIVKPVLMLTLVSPVNLTPTETHHTNVHVSLDTMNLKTKSVLLVTSNV